MSAASAASAGQLLDPKDDDSEHGVPPTKLTDNKDHVDGMLPIPPMDPATDAANAALLGDLGGLRDFTSAGSAGLLKQPQEWSNGSVDTTSCGSRSGEASAASAPAGMPGGIVVGGFKILLGRDASLGKDDGCMEASDLLAVKQECRARGCSAFVVYSGKATFWRQPAAEFLAGLIDRPGCTAFIDVGSQKEPARDPGLLPLDSTAEEERITDFDLSPLLSDQGDDIAPPVKEGTGDSCGSLPLPEVGEAGQLPGLSNAEMPLQQEGTREAGRLPVCRENTTGSLSEEVDFLLQKEHLMDQDVLLQQQQQQQQQHHHLQPWWQRRPCRGGGRGPLPPVIDDVTGELPRPPGQIAWNPRPAQVRPPSSRSPTGAVAWEDTQTSARIPERSWVSPSGRESPTCGQSTARTERHWIPPRRNEGWWCPTGRAAELRMHDGERTGADRFGPVWEVDGSITQRCTPRRRRRGPPMRFLEASSIPPSEDGDPIDREERSNQCQCFTQ